MASRSIRQTRIQLRPEQLERRQELLDLFDQAGMEGMTEEERAELDILVPPDTGPNLQDHYVNLAELMEEKELNKIGDIIVQRFEDDERSRREWYEREAMGIRLMGVAERLTREGYYANVSDQQFEDFMKEEERPFEGASRVHHPLLAEAAVQFEARAIHELWPAGGPVKTEVLGETNAEVEAQAQRVAAYMNYQYSTLMPGAFHEEEKMLMRLPISGSCFTKAYYDELKGGVVRKFVDGKDFVVPYSATDLMDAARSTHMLFRHKNTLLKSMAAGVYRDVDLGPPDENNKIPNPVQDAVDLTEGKQKSHLEDSDDQYTLLEHYCSWNLPIEGLEDSRGIEKPLVITVDKGTGKILSIYRNWRVNDPLIRQRVYFTHYVFVPGFGFYGFGLVHLIGGLAKAGTGALRALMDAAHFANLQGGFRSNDFLGEDSDLTLEAGKWKAVNMTGEQLQNSFYTPNFQGPSDTLFSLLGYIDEVGRRMASTTEAVVGDASNNAPVGTTLALIEQGTRVFSSIHKRIHVAHKEEFALIADLNKEFIAPQGYPYRTYGADQTIMAQDFDDRVDILPVSDPEFVTTAQRVATAQALLELAAQAPDIYNRRIVHLRMLQAMRVQNPEELVPDQSVVPRLDPVTENVLIIQLQAVKAFPDQDHAGHMMVHQAMFDALDGEEQKRVDGVFSAHQAEHRAMAYLQQMQQLMQTQFPEGEVSPEMDAMITQMAAQASAAIQPLPAATTTAEQAEIQREEEKAARAEDRKDLQLVSQIERSNVQTAADISRQNEQTRAKLVNEFAETIVDNDIKRQVNQGAPQ